MATCFLTLNYLEMPFLLKSVSASVCLESLLPGYQRQHYAKTNKHAVLHRRRKRSLWLETLERIKCLCGVLGSSHERRRRTALGVV